MLPQTPNSIFLFCNMLGGALAEVFPDCWSAALVMVPVSESGKDLRLVEFLFQLVTHAVVEFTF